MIGGSTYVYRMIFSTLFNFDFCNDFFKFKDLYGSLDFVPCEFFDTEFGMTHMRAGACNKLKTNDCTDGECPPPATTGECKDKAGTQWVHSMTLVHTTCGNGCFEGVHK